MNNRTNAQWDEQSALTNARKIKLNDGHSLSVQAPPMMPHMSLTAAQIRAKYLGVSGDDEEMTEHFFEDLYKEAPYLKDANPQEVLDLYKAGLLNVFEEMGGWW